MVGGTGGRLAGYRFCKLKCVKINLQDFKGVQKDEWEESFVRIEVGIV